MSVLPEDLEYLVDFGIRREQDFASAHLSEDCTYGPHVNTSRILTLGTTEQNFRGSIEEGDDLWKRKIN